MIPPPLCARGRVRPRRARVTRARRLASIAACEHARRTASDHADAWRTQGLSRQSYIVYCIMGIRIAVGSRRAARTDASRNSRPHRAHREIHSLVALARTTARRQRRRRTARRPPTRRDAMRGCPSKANPLSSPVPHGLLRRSTTHRTCTPTTATQLAVRRQPRSQPRAG